MEPKNLAEGNYENQFEQIKSLGHYSNPSDRDIKMAFYHDVMGKLSQIHLDRFKKEQNLLKVYPHSKWRIKTIHWFHFDTFKVLVQVKTPIMNLCNCMKKSMITKN